MSKIMGALVVLMVVITIIGLLIGLTIPAVQSAREAQCLSNLKQLELAVLNCHDSLRSFPPASGGRWGQSTAVKTSRCKPKENSVKREQCQKRKPFYAR